MSTENEGKTETQDSTTLSTLFDKAFESFSNISKAQEPTNSPAVQIQIKKTISMLEDATKLVSLTDMFSSNENFEEVSTENLKYFLLPVLLGTLATKICGASDRTNIVDVAEIYFVDFLKRVKAYGLTDIEIPERKSEDDEDETSVERSKSNAEMITEMVLRRNTKLQRFKEQKDLESRLDVLRKNMDNLNIDDEVKRDYFVTLIKLYVTQTIDELSSLAAEKQILKHMQKIGKGDSMSSETSKKQKLPAPKLQPIIITRDQVQKKVYGAGYPSLPVMTVEEFYEKKIKDGEWSDPSQFNKINGKSMQDMANCSNDGNSQEEIEEAEKEERIERDDPELLEQTRAMDEYKDTHRRGWGNRYNRS